MTEAPQAARHRLFRGAVAAAARALEKRAVSMAANSLRENDFRAALRSALEAGEEVCATEVRPALPGWPSNKGNPLGGIDISVAASTQGEHRYLAELKWCYEDKLWETLWDVLKAGAASQVAGTEAAYVVAGAPDSYWAKPVACAELFADGLWATRDLIARYSTNWSWLLGEGSKSQPRQLSELFQTELAVEEPLLLLGKPWTIKAVAVRAVGDLSVDFENGWPVEQLLDLRALPRAAAEQIETLKEAISSPVPEDVVVWRYFSSPVLYEQSQRLVGTEIRDLGFTDVTLAQEVALNHLPTEHPVLAAILLPEGTPIAPLMLITESEDADLLLGPGTRFQVMYAREERGRLEIGMKVVA
ncbi:MAG TPA: hypothetical protein VKR79_02120 [Gaiellaceae bacterium]|nr:hypothetical protein [Gaiellaceae bacterium]